MTGNRIFHFNKKNGLYCEILFSDYIAYNIPYKKIVENENEYKSFIVRINVYQKWDNRKLIYSKQLKRIDRPFKNSELKRYFKNHSGYIGYNQWIQNVNIDFQELFESVGYNFITKVYKN